MTEEEVVTNYLSNAIHYAGGKKEISIRCREQEKNVRIRLQYQGRFQEGGYRQNLVQVLQGR